MARHTNVKDQDKVALSAEDMIAELRDDNAALIAQLKAMKSLAEQVGDNATEGLLDGWTDMAEQRVWFLTSLLA
jgi:starvation-inducible DNA-binding protein